MSDYYLYGFLQKCAEVGIDPKVLVKAAGVFDRAARSFAEAGLLRRLQKLDVPTPLEQLRRQLKLVEERPVDLADDSWLIADAQRNLQQQLFDAERREALLGSDLRLKAQRMWKMHPLEEALHQEVQRLAELTPDQLAEEKQRMLAMIAKREANKIPVYESKPGRFKARERYW